MPSMVVLSKRNIIPRWRIALCARASHVRNVGLGSWWTASRRRGETGKGARQLSRARVWKGIRIRAGETRVFEVPLSLFERRHFYRSELS